MYMYPQNVCCKYAKISVKKINLNVMRFKDEVRIANSIDSDQTAPYGTGELIKQT